MDVRTSSIRRKTNETDISLTLNIDGSGVADIETGIGFFDHMLNSFARHGQFDLQLKVEGDLYVDCHHTVEDVGIVLGCAIKEALAEKNGIHRYGSCLLPMDETLAMCAIDLSGRPYFVFQADFPTERCGTMDTEMVREFFYAVCMNADMNLHLKIEYGSNSHHMIEGLFKAFARALDEASAKDARVHGVLSTKGSL